MQGLSSRTIGNSLPQEIATNERETLTRSICVHIKSWPDLQSRQIRGIARRLAIDQESVAMLLSAQWTEGLVYRVGNRFLVCNTAGLCVVPSNQISQS